MANSTANITGEKQKYSKLLSSLFCSSSVVVLSLLCLLNNLSFDIYSAGMLLRVVIPASFCFWFIGYVMGHILDNNHDSTGKVKEFKLSNNNEAYEIPSVFASEASDTQDNEIGEL